MTRTLLALVVVFCLAVPAGGDEEALIFVPEVVSDAPLDGLLDAPASVPALGVEPLRVRTPRGDEGVVSFGVTASVVGGALRIGVEAAEEPGAGIGLALMVVEDGASSAADALSVSYSPLEARAALLSVRGPRGIGRGVYRVEAAAALRRGDRWSVEVQIPLADLGLSSTAAPLRMAAALRPRSAAPLAWLPAGAAFAGPAAWIRVDPPSGGWPLDAAGPDAEALGRADEQDRLRLEAWARFFRASITSVHDLVKAAGVEGGALEAPEEQVAEVLLDALVQPLVEAATHRPDLATLHVARGHVLRLLGYADEARAAYERALQIVPGLPEARYGLGIGLRAPAIVAGPPGARTDFATALQRVEVDAAAAGEDGILGDGVALGRGLLLHARGAFDEAAPILDALAKRYPFSHLVVYAAERNRQAEKDWMRELGYRERDAAQGDLPRARVETTKGEIVLELLENDAPNTVHDFVWLARHGFYAGASLETVPFFATRVAEGQDAGYAIPTELPHSDATWRPGASRDLRRRRPWRGAAVRLSPARDGGGGGFAILTGTALHLESEYVAFARVIEGLDVLDALDGEDRIVSVAVERERPGSTYRPFTVDGKPAPEPR